MRFMILPASGLVLSSFILTTLASPITPTDPYEPPNQYMKIVPERIQELANQQYAQCLLQWFEGKSIQFSWFGHEIMCREDLKRLVWNGIPVFPDGPWIEKEPATKEELITVLGRRYKQPQEGRSADSETQGNQEGSGPLPFSLHDKARTFRDNFVRFGNGIGAAINKVNGQSPVKGMPMPMPMPRNPKGPINPAMSPARKFVW